MPADIEAALERLFGRSGTTGDTMQPGGERDELGAEDDVQRLRDLASEAPVIRMVNRLIYQGGRVARVRHPHRAVRERLRVRYRIDGVLHEVETPPRQLRPRSSPASRSWRGSTSPSAACRRTAASSLRCAARRSTSASPPCPTLHGEAWCCASSTAAASPSISSRSASKTPALDAYREALGAPDGIILVTGPTGSGKTTTLYASLDELNSPDRKIITVEDPIEYQLDGVNQMQVKPQIGLTFANVLRSILRQDPDVIMVGEIRDLETARDRDPGGAHGPPRPLDAAHQRRREHADRLLDMGVKTI